MNRILKPRLVAGAVAGIAVAGGGAALAASHFSSPKQESQAVLNDAAKQLGVQPSALTSALKKALENRVDAAVADGRLTKDQGAELKKRIEAGDVPLLGGPFLGGPGSDHFGPFGMHDFGLFADRLSAAAAYLDLTTAKLEAQLNDGKTLAQVAKAQGKSVDGLVTAMYDAAKKKLDDAVDAGRLTKTQEASVLQNLKSRIERFVNNAQLRVHHDGDRGLFHGGRPPVAISPARSFGDPGI